MRTLTLFLIAVPTLFDPVLALANEPNSQRDTAALPTLRGPLPSGQYHGVRIVSDSVGVIAIHATTIVNSVIEAPVCVLSSGHELTLRGNLLNCELCVEFTEGLLLNLQIADNQCNGRGTNRPDILRW